MTSARVVLAILVAGAAATAARIIGQLLIPPGQQTVLEPSVFAANGTMPLAFTIYGIVAYSAVAALFLLVRDRLPGTPVVRGLLFGLSCAVVWTLYLLEPLPHVAPLDRFTYPLADSAALVVLGVVIGALLGRRPRLAATGPPFEIPGALAVAGGLIGLRLITYSTVGLYSEWSEAPGTTILWLAATGIGVGVVLAALRPYLVPAGRLATAAMLGGLVFGLDLLFFNGFMPLVFAADLPDLILRTAIDVVGVTLGALAFAAVRQGASPARVDPAPSGR